MRTPEAIQAEMDSAEEAHEQRMSALHDELFAAEEAADPGCHERECERRVSQMVESLRRTKEWREKMAADEDDPSKERDNT
jgi:hypothetical protein